MTQYDIDLRDYWRIIKKRKSIIIFSMITLLIFSFIFGKYKKSREVVYFGSSATIRIDKAYTAEEYVMKMYGFSPSDNIATDVETITSFPVMADVAALQGGWLPDSLTSMPIEERNKIIENDPELLRRVNMLTTMVRPERSSYTDFIVVNTVAYDPVDARDLAKNTVEAYKEFRKKQANQRMKNAIKFLKVKIDGIVAESDSIQAIINEFSKNNDSMLAFSSDDVLSSEIRIKDREKRRLESRRMTTELMIEYLEKGGMIDDSILSNAFAEEEGGVFREKYVALQRLLEQRTEMLRYLTEDHSEVRAITVSIENTKKRMVEQLKSNLQSLELMQENTSNVLADLKGKFQSTVSQNDSLQRLIHQKKVLDESQLTYVEQLQVFEIKESENIDEVTITKPAVINMAPISHSSSVTTTSFIGMFLGMVIGLIAAFIFEALDTSIGTIEDVEAYIGVPVIGLIPQIEVDSLKNNRYSPKLANDHDQEILDDHAMLVIHYAPKSVLSESYRSLRTNIQFISYEQEANILLFTSSSPREGKTTTIVNMALTMAQSGNQVLLVDADLRRPSISTIFGLEKERGLSEIILGKRQWKECVKTVTDIITGDLGMSDIILEPGIDNLHIITCGTIPPNPSELLNSDSMDEFIADVRNVYDIVLFDCSPCLPATDSAVLGRKIDGVVLVYAVGRVSRASLKRAKSQLDNVKARVIGIVLNGIRSELSSDFQDYRYKEYYYYGEDGEPEYKGVKKIKKVVENFISRFV